MCLFYFFSLHIHTNTGIGGVRAALILYTINCTCSWCEDIQYIWIYIYIHTGCWCGIHSQSIITKHSRHTSGSSFRAWHRTPIYILYLPIFCIYTKPIQDYKSQILNRKKNGNRINRNRKIEQEKIEVENIINMERKIEQKINYRI